MKHPNPKLPRNSLRRPTVDELLALVETLTFAAHLIMTRWDDDVTAEIRNEVGTNIYQPGLQMLIRAKRQPLPR